MRLPVSLTSSWKCAAVTPTVSYYFSKVLVSLRKKVKSGTFSSLLAYRHQINISKVSKSSGDSWEGVSAVGLGRAGSPCYSAEGTCLLCYWTLFSRFRVISALCLFLPCVSFYTPQNCVFLFSLSCVLIVEVYLLSSLFP